MIHSKHSRYALAFTVSLSSSDTSVRTSLLLRGVGRQAGQKYWTWPINTKVPFHMRLPVTGESVLGCLINPTGHPVAKERLAG